MTKSVLMGEVLHLAFLGSRLKDSARRDYPIVLNNPVYRNGCGKKKNLLHKDGMTFLKKMSK